jgi:hypothetical protein
VSGYIVREFTRWFPGLPNFASGTFSKWKKTGQWATALDHWFGLVLATPMYLKLTKWYEPTIMYTQSVNPRYFNTVSTCLEAKDDG